MVLQNLHTSFCLDYHSIKLGCVIISYEIILLQQSLAVSGICQINSNMFSLHC